MATTVPLGRPADGLPPGQRLDALGVYTGTLHAQIAFDWGDEVFLDRALQLVPGEVQALARRRRTPPSIEFRPPPLRLSLSPLPLELPEIGSVTATAEAAIFDFAAVNVTLHFPFRLSATRLSALANYLATPEELVRTARHAVEPFYQRLLPAIENPSWSNLSEEYFVLQLPPGGPLPSLAALLTEHTDWLASLVRLDTEPLSPEEVAQALRLRISYTPDDLFVADWPAAVLIDRDCDETLRVIEFANVQLLEYRNIDQRLDGILGNAYQLIHGLSRSWLPFWRSQAQPLRVLGDLQVEATEVFERTGNVLKLVGDQYLARVYRLLANRFHLEEWERSIRRKLEVLEGIFQTLSDQAATYRAEFLELTIILLIVIEIVLALVVRK